MNREPAPAYGSISAVGRRFGYSADTIERLIQNGDLTAYRLPGSDRLGHRRIKFADVEALLVPDGVLAEIEAQVEADIDEEQ